MAQAGFDAVAIDLFLHGDRPEASNFNRFLEANYAGTVLTITNESVDDIPAICGEIGVDIARAGLLGISTGGFVAHALALRRPHFGATVAAITSPEWLTIDPEQSALLSPMEAAMLAQISPVNHPAQYAPMPICMLHSAGDSTVRIQGTQTLAERLQPIYESLQISDRLKLKVYPDDEHRFSEDMLDETIAWMNLHL